MTAQMKIVTFLKRNSVTSLTHIAFGRGALNCRATRFLLFLHRAGDGLEHSDHVFYPLAALQEVVQLTPRQFGLFA